MDCQETRNRLDAWVDGELSAEAAERIVYHLNVCPTCRHSAEELRQMVAALDHLPHLKKARRNIVRFLSTNGPVDRDKLPTVCRSINAPPCWCVTPSSFPTTASPRLWICRSAPSSHCSCVAAER